jgi:hypothetical protein
MSQQGGTPPEFVLRFPLSEVRKWAALYDYPGEAELIAGPVESGRTRGYLTRAEFLAVAEWKSARPRKRYQTNSSDRIEEITRIAFAPSTSPQLAIEILMLLSGVKWPTASVLLHFCHLEPFPILDFRALWSLSLDVPSHYGFALWDRYCHATRSLAAAANVDMRTLDRALWKYSEIHQ